MRTKKLKSGLLLSLLVALGLMLFPKLDVRANGGSGSRWEASFCWCDYYDTYCTVCNYPSQYGCSAPELCQCCWVSIPEQ